MAWSYCTPVIDEKGERNFIRKIWRRMRLIIIMRGRKKSIKTDLKGTRLWNCGLRFIWLSTGTTGGLLWTQRWNKLPAIFWHVALCRLVAVSVLQFRYSYCFHIIVVPDDGSLTLLGTPQGLTIIVSTGSGAPKVLSYPVPAGIARPLSSGIIYEETWSSRCGSWARGWKPPPVKSHV